MARKPCDGKEEQLHWARESCRAIREQGIFQKCHSSVDPETFYDMCLQVESSELVGDVQIQIGMK